MIETIRTVGIVACLVVGLFFTLVSTIGVLRLPDIYTRAHTASQADTLGAGFSLAGVVLAIGVESVSLKALLLLFFIFVTNPTAAHAIARAAHEEQVVPWTEETREEGGPVADGGDDRLDDTTGGDAEG